MALGSHQSSNIKVRQIVKVRIAKLFFIGKEYPFVEINNY
jgi:hypothetical protein